MKRWVFIGLLIALGLPAWAQQAWQTNVRLSFLLVPFTPLLTVETRLGNSPIAWQGETNFHQVHGLNLKLYLRQALEGPYAFVGQAWVADSRLRADKQYTQLPYAGAGWAWPISSWGQADARLGMGPAWNADTPAWYPVAKGGVGIRF